MKLKIKSSSSSMMIPSNSYISLFTGTNLEIYNAERHSLILSLEDYKISFSMEDSETTIILSGYYWAFNNWQKICLVCV